MSLPSVPRLMRMAKILGTLAESLYMHFYMPGASGGLEAGAGAA